MNATLRIDKWLWFARFCKTRSLAQALCTEGRVTLNSEKVKKPNRLVRVGDTVAVVIGPIKRKVTVAALGERRGPASEAALLYEDPHPPERLNIEEKEVPFHRPRGAGRPTKRDRRALEKLFTGYDQE